MNILYDINVLTYIFYKMFLFPLSRYSRCVLQNDRVLESQKKDVGSKVNLPFEPAGCGEKNMTCRGVPVSVFCGPGNF